MPSAYYELVSVFREIGIALSASLPDDWVSPLIELLDSEPGIRSVRVAREPEIIGICSGAFFGGIKTVGVMGATGFLTCISEIVTLNLRHQIPLFLMVSLRGTMHDPQVFQEVQGRLLLPLLGTMGLPHLVLASRQQFRLLPEVFRHSRLQKRPFVACLSKTVLREE